MIAQIQLYKYVLKFYNMFFMFLIVKYIPEWFLFFSTLK